MEIIIDEEVKKVLGRSQSFGELALLYNAPRSASVRCVEKSFFWALERQQFKRKLEDLNTKQQAENFSFIENIKFFGCLFSESLTREQKSSIASIMIHEKYRAGDKIVSQGDLASCFFVIKEVAITQGDGRGEEEGSGAAREADPQADEERLLRRAGAVLRHHAHLQRRRSLRSHLPLHRFR